jgi:GT2 family glycosyltransferase
MLGDDLLRFLYLECPWQTTAATWRRAALERLGGFDERLPSWQDVDLHVRAIAAGCRYIRLATVDHHMRWQVDGTKVSLQQRHSPEHLEAAARLLWKFQQIVADGPGMTWVRQRALCSLYFFVAERWTTIGRPGEAQRLWAAVRRRHLGPRSLHVAGAALLAMQAARVPLAQRVTHKWKGLVRLRTNPELLLR